MPDTTFTVARPSGISYLRIPAPDPHALAAFYAAVFGWSMRLDPGRAAFEDGTGHVIGHLVPDLPVAGEAGIVPYVYVPDVAATLAAAVEHGAAVLRDVYAEGHLSVALLRDPAGNTIGIWQDTTR